MANYNIGDMIRLTRLAEGLSQEELSEGICSVQTLSRIENGKVSVKKKVYQSLMERMGRTSTKNFSVLTVEDYDVFEMVRKINNLLYRREYESAEVLLEEFKTKVDLDNELNAQYVLQAESGIRYLLGKITCESYIEVLEESLAKTLCNYEKYIDKIYPFTQREVIILTNLMNAYGEIDNDEKAISIGYMLLRSLNSGYMEQKQAIQSIAIIINSIARIYGGQGKYEKAIRMCWNAIEKGKKYHLYSVMPTAYAEIAINMKKQIDKGLRDYEDAEICKKLMRQSYASAALTKQYAIGRVTVDVYEEMFEEKIYRPIGGRCGDFPSSDCVVE